MSDLSLHTPILSAEYAKSVNDKIIERIDDKLFMICNYSPDTYPVFSEKEIFETSINDLYRFAFDSGFVLSKLEIIVKEADLHNQNIGGKLRKTVNRIRTLTERIKALRIYKTHNCDERNGFFSRIACQSFENAIGYRKLTCEEDYIFLNTKLLQKIRDSMISDISEFIDNVALLDDEDKSNLTLQWKKEIIAYYCKSHNNHYVGQMIDMMSLQLSQSDFRKINSQNAFAIAKKWIQNYYHQSVSSCHNKLEKHKKEMGEIELYLQSNECDEELKRVLLEEKEKSERTIQEITHKLPTVEKNDKLDNDEQFKLFFDNLSDQLLDIIKTEQYQSMLPQDLLQKHISIYFKNVPMPILC